MKWVLPLAISLGMWSGSSPGFSQEEFQPDPCPDPSSIRIVTQGESIDPCSPLPEKKNCLFAHREAIRECRAYCTRIGRFCAWKLKDDGIYIINCRNGSGGPSFKGRFELPDGGVSNFTLTSIPRDDDFRDLTTDRWFCRKRVTCECEPNLPEIVHIPNEIRRTFRLAGLNQGAILPVGGSVDFHGTEYFWNAAPFGSPGAALFINGGARSDHVPQTTNLHFLCDDGFIQVVHSEIGPFQPDAVVTLGPEGDVNCLTAWAFIEDVPELVP